MTHHDIRAVPWDDPFRERWNAFVEGAKNATFLFHRDYLEYHADRFVDSSLLFFEDEMLIALLPATVSGDTVTSHGGLTFGGIITDARMRTSQMLRIFDFVLKTYRTRGIRTIVYKAVPHIYHSMPSEEDLYALFRNGARLVRRDVATTIACGAAAPYSKGRKYSVSKGKRNGLTVGRSEAFEEFMALEQQTLASRHGVVPVHSAAEMRLLASRFPNNIKLYDARLDGRLLAGMVVYESTRVAHAQYIASNEEGRELFAPDVLTDWLLETKFKEKAYFDFGISTEDQGTVLNAGLSRNKESYGGRATVYDFYEITL